MPPISHLASHRHVTSNDIRAHHHIKPLPIPRPRRHPIAIPRSLFPLLSCLSACLNHCPPAQGSRLRWHGSISVTKPSRGENNLQCSRPNLRLLSQKWKKKKRDQHKERDISVLSIETTERLTARETGEIFFYNVQQSIN